MRYIFSLLLIVLACGGCAATSSGRKAEQKKHKIAELLAAGPVATEDWREVDRHRIAQNRQRVTYREPGGKRLEVWLDNDGFVLEEAMYQGQEVVLDMGWYPGGVRHHELNYEGGLMKSFKVWYPDGKLQQEWTLKEGWKETSTGYTPQGDVNYEARYSEGEPVERVFHLRDGRLAERQAR